MLSQTYADFCAYMLSQVCPSLWTPHECQLLLHDVLLREREASQHEVSLLSGLGGRKRNQEAQHWGAYCLWSRRGRMPGKWCWGWDDCHRWLARWALTPSHFVNCFQGKQRFCNKCFSEMPAARGRSVLNKLPLNSRDAIHWSSESLFLGSKPLEFALRLEFTAYPKMLGWVYQAEGRSQRTSDLYLMKKTRENPGWAGGQSNGLGKWSLLQQFLKWM